MNRPSLDGNAANEPPKARATYVRHLPEAGSTTGPRLILYDALVRASENISFHTSGNKAERQRKVGFESQEKEAVNI